MKIRLVYNSGITITYDLPDQLQIDDDVEEERENIIASEEFVGEVATKKELEKLTKFENMIKEHYTQAIGILRMIFFKYEPNPQLVDTIIAEIHKIQGLDSSDKLITVLTITNEEEEK